MTAHSIATKTGDDGTTSLLYGQRVSKAHPQIEAVGALDELNVALGAAKLTLSDSALQSFIAGLQQTLVAVMGEIACAETDAARYAASQFAKLDEAAVGSIDERITELEGRGLKFDGWATPGANATSVAFDQARVIARRAERRLVDLPAQGRNLRPLIFAWVNRLSDLLWLLARAAEPSA